MGVGSMAQLGAVAPWRAGFRVRDLAIAVALVAVGALLRVWPLQALGTSLAWLTFYPIVMVAAIVGGFWVGEVTVAMAIAVVLFAGPLLVGGAFIATSADVLGMVVFVLNGTMMCWLAEAMRQANARARRAQSTAEAANRAKSDFLASMSHELRTPLNAILGFSAMLAEDDNLTEAQRGDLRTIRRSGEHLLRLINDVLDMAKIESGRVALADDVVSVDDAVRDVVLMLRNPAEAKGLELDLDLSAPHPATVRGDLGKLRQVLINLVGNAVKYTDSGRITVAVEQRPPDPGRQPVLVLTVADTGVGISPADQEAIFEAFTQATDGPVRPGAGLGLAISRRYVTAMGGTISVDSTPGVGSCFTVEVPYRAVDGAAVPQPEQSQPAVTGRAPGQPRPRMLVVEDNALNAELLTRVLAPVDGEVRYAVDGEQAVATFVDWRPDLIWMDVRMPVMDGREATRRIRAATGGDVVRIIGVTASSFEDQRADLLAAGMDDVIHKPYRQDQIHHALERHLGLRLVRAGDQGVDRPAATGPHARAVRELPPDVRIALREALLSLEDDRIGSALDDAARIDPACAGQLRDLVDGLAYTRALALLADPSADVVAGPS